VKRAAIVALALSLVAAPVAAQPVTEERPRLADSSGIPGSELSVYLITMGQGDLLWERYGHNAIGIRDARTGADMVYNWGIFSFDQPGFVGRFLRGEMMYWMAPFDGRQTIAEYIAYNRGVTIQELNFSPAQRIAMRDFVLWNAREENKYYAYDYFRDNCSTRVRDALDRVLGGAIRFATESLSTSFSYRDHSLRLMAEDPLVSVGMNIGLGRPSDRPITAWEEMFIPMKLRDRLREIMVPDERGRPVPLVTAERIVFEAQRVPERAAPPARGPLLFGLGLLLAAGLWWFARRGRRGSVGSRRLASVGAVAGAIVAGLLGTVLVLLRVATRHVWAYGNMNLFFYNPLWLLLVLLVGLAALRPRLAGTARWTARVVQWLSVLGIVVWLLPPLRQDSLAVMLLALPVNLVVAQLLRPPVSPPAVPIAAPTA
jgi:hypothetical protein